jgi:hypothetical protein
MSYSMYLCASLATYGLDLCPTKDPAPQLHDVLEPVLARLRQLIDSLRGSPVGPLTVGRFEQELNQQLRELGRITTEWTYNHLEAEPAQARPEQVVFQTSTYRRLSAKTPQEVSTLFGKIRLQRQGYRAAASVGDGVLFPLCRELGLVQGTTPALLECVARYQAQSGATQRQTLARLRAEHGLQWGVKKLRQVTAALAQLLGEHRQEAQVEQVLDWLAQAEASPGRHRPVLAVGRDGITLGLQIKGCDIHEVASTGTLTVYDRRGQRLGTVYLAFTPEQCQVTMSTQLTALVREVLGRWQGRLPRLAYVTDAGDNETTYYRKVLRRLRHPRTGQRLPWVWVVDYYHASERLWTMAEALFGSGPQGWSWVRKMQKWLLRPGGLSRVLHSAGALCGRGQLTGTRRRDFRRAYNYLSSRRQHLRYWEFRRWGLPIGSGVTEAACKTVYTQRLKLSGMRWKKPGAQMILTLRVLWLSGVWTKVYERTFNSNSDIEVPTSASSAHHATDFAA